MTTTELLAVLREREVRLWADGERLRCAAPPGALDELLQSEVSARKEELLALVAIGDELRAAPRSLVPLKPHGRRLPVFARPGHNGDVFCYRFLCDHVDPERPLYGVEPKGLDGTKPAATVEEMAQYEVEQIRSFQPEGPYVIAGFCAGGSVAFEMARQLVEAGADVARVFLIGSPWPAAYQASRVRLQARSVKNRARLHSSRIRAGSLSEGIGYVGTRLGGRVSRVAERPDAALDDRRRVEYATMEAVKRYVPGWYPGRVDLFLPNEAWRSSGDRSDDWKLVSGEVVEHIGPDDCDGDSMLHEPWVGALAASLNSALDDTGESDASGR